jgi:hypothetical protein
MKTEKRVDLPLGLYEKLLSYAKENKLKSQSSTQGTFVIAAMENLVENYIASPNTESEKS